MAERFEGVSGHRLSSWVARGWARPDRTPSRRGLTGAGVAYEWTEEEAAIVRRMARLTAAGIAPAVAAEYARNGWPAGEIAPGLTLTVTEGFRG